MKKIDLGQTIGILANVGVLVGILLLVFELNQNRQMMQAPALLQEKCYRPESLPHAKCYR